MKRAPNLLSIVFTCLALTVGGCEDDPDDAAQRRAMSGGMDEDAAAGDPGGRLRAPDAGGGADTGSDASAGQDEGIEIAGTWTSEWGDETISDDAWNGSAIIRFDNGLNEVITQDAPDEDAGTTSGLFNKIVWTEPKNDAFFYCWVAFGQPSPEAADEAAMPADTSDPASGGCGDMGFAWTKLERK